MFHSSRLLSRRFCVCITAIILILSVTGSLVTQQRNASAAPSRTAALSIVAVKTVSFHLKFAQKFAQITCPAGTVSTTFCLWVTGSTEDKRFEDASFARRAFLTNVLDPASPACNPAFTNGTLTTSHGDTLTFSANGTYCKDVQIAAYIFVITGGTGRYQGASGSGIISVPPFTGPGIGTETWDGSVTFTSSK